MKDVNTADRDLFFPLSPVTQFMYLCPRGKRAGNVNTVLIPDSFKKKKKDVKKTVQPLKCCTLSLRESYFLLQPR